MKNGIASTGNMWNHYNKKHVNQSESNSNGTFKKEELTENITQWIMDEMYPYTISEEQGYMK